jgi:hypothetical protein
MLCRANHDSVTGLPGMLVAVRPSRVSCEKAEKREYSFQFRGHPGSPGPVY